MTWWLTDHISAEHYNNVTNAEKQVLKFYIIACQGRNEKDNVLDCIGCQ